MLLYHYRNAKNSIYLTEMSPQEDMPFHSDTLS